MHIGRRLARPLARTSLLVRYGVVSGLLVVCLGLALGYVLASTVYDRALAQSEETAANIAQLAVGPLLQRDDFDQGAIAPERRERLTRAVDTLVADQTVVRVKIFDRTGTVLFADDPDLVGQRFTTVPDLQAALGGRPSSDLDEPDSAENASEASLGRLVEVYVPIRKSTAAGADRGVVGAFEIYLPYEPVASSAAADTRRLLLWLAGGLVVLWTVLFQLVAAASRRLRDYAREQAQRAQHDALTGLPNRVLLTDRANQALLVSRRSGTSTALLIADLDRLKEVNDSLGHHFGDLLISAVGARLRGELREADTVARLGGDEFAVLLPEVIGVDAALEVADRLVEAMRIPFDIDGVSLEVGATLGLASYPEHGRDVVRLLKCADVAMHAAKNDRRVVRVYDRSMDAFTPDRLALFGELRRAIENNELSVHYQPQVDINSGRVTGVEGLVRWQHTVHGLLPPDEFIPLAEHTGLIRPLTWSVLRMAVSACQRWRAAGLDLTVAVNLSVRSLLDEDLVAELDRLLRDVGLPASALELEITETTVMADTERSLAVLADLRGLGVRLSIDDYGTGQASLAYLSRLPVDTLKIDRSFVIAMLGSSNDAAIVRSTIELSRSLGLGVVAEGVETEQTWQRLRDLGCDAAQGNWLAAPAPADSMPDLVRRLERRLGEAPART